MRQVSRRTPRLRIPPRGNTPLSPRTACTFSNNAGRLACCSMLSVYSAMKCGMCVSRATSNPWVARERVSEGENGVDLASTGTAEGLGQHFHRLVVFRAAEQAEEHGRVVHLAFAEAMLCVVREHRAEFLEAALLPHLDHVQVHLLVELTGPVMNVGFGFAVIGETVRQRPRGQYQHLAVALFDGPAYGGAKGKAVFQAVPGTPGGNGDHLEFLLIGDAHVHIAHRHQRAVFQLQARDVVSHGADPGQIGLGRDQLAQFRAARVGVFHVLDEVRQFVAGVDTLELFAAVDVIAAVDQPVHVEHHRGIGPQFTGAAADFLVPGNRRFAAAMVLAGQFGQVHRGYVADLRGQDDFAHDDSPEILVIRFNRAASEVCDKPMFGPSWSSTAATSGSDTPARDVMTAHGDADVLDFGEDFEAVLAAFTAGTGTFHTAERLTQVAHVLAVDEDHAGFDAVGQAMGLADVLGPDIGRQTILGIVGQLQGLGFILEWDQAHYRTKDLFLGNAHLVVHIGEHRRLDELPATQVRRQVGRAFQATGQQGGAFLDTDLDVAGDLVIVGLSDHRANLGFWVLRVADDQALGAGGKLGDELRVDAFLNEDPATGGAAFTVEREDGEQCRVEGAVQVGVFEDQHRRLAAQFHGVLFQAGGLHDFLAGGGAAGEGDRPHVGVPDQCVTGRGAVALDDVEHALGNTSLDGQTPQFIGSQR